MRPGEGADQTLEESAAAQNTSSYEVMNYRLDQAGRENEQRVDERLEKDRVNQRRMIEASQERHLVRNQHALSDKERAGRCDNKPSILNEIVFEYQPLSEQDQVEADEEEQGRRH